MGMAALRGPGVGAHLLNCAPLGDARREKSDDPVDKPQSSSFQAASTTPTRTASIASRAQDRTVPGPAALAI